LRLERASDQPVLAPRSHVKWESDAICNAAAVLAYDKVHLFYRAINHPGWRKGQPGGRYDSCIGYAVSADGLHFERPDEPVLAFNTEYDGHLISDPEDPRVTALDGRFHITYCDWNGRACQTGLASSDDLRSWHNHGIVVPFEGFGNNKNAALFPRRIAGGYAMIHRPEPRECLDPSRRFDWIWWSRSSDHLGGMRLSFSDDLLNWSYENECFMMPRPDSWDSAKIGLAGPPMEIDRGWLVVYHGVDHDDVYRLGMALLDLENPASVLYRQAEPILEPELDWERNGDVANVVFSCGSFVVGDQLWVYYGAADRVIGLAKGDIAGFPGALWQSLP